VRLTRQETIAAACVFAIRLSQANREKRKRDTPLLGSWHARVPNVGGPMADDPTAAPEPVRLAIRGTFVLGVACTLFGVVFLVAFGYLNRYQQYRPYFMAMGLVVWFGPGAVFVACAYLMRRHARGGASGALATAGFQFILAAALLVASATFEPVSPLPLVLGALWLVALADLMRRLVSARRFLAAETTRTRGFDLSATPRAVLPLGGTFAESEPGSD
jgi:hypothetical protein